ncbi:hypothetical protein DMENIID0001_021160 [Sergentomyia squamirostris]
MAQNSVVSPPMSPLSPQSSSAQPSPSTSGAVNTLSSNQLKLQALKQRKAELEKKLSEKNSQLQEICRKEAQLIGVYPVAGDVSCLQTSATLPRKVGTSFKLSEVLINNKEDDVNNLLLQKQVQQQICKASQKLMSDTSQPKSVRRTHKANYEAAHQKLLAINHALALYKRRQYQQHAEESPAMRRNSVGSATTVTGRSKAASITSDSSGNINGSEGALNESSVGYHLLHHSPTKSVASFPGAGHHGNRKHGGTSQFYPAYQHSPPVDPQDYFYNNHHLKHRSAILLQQQQQQHHYHQPQNVQLFYVEEPQIFLQPPELFSDHFVEPSPPPSTSYQQHHPVLAPVQPELEAGAFGVGGLGGYWALNENNERVWCSMERFSSLDRNKQQSRAMRTSHNVTPTKSTSLGNFDFLTKQDVDTISLSSISSEKKQLLREKVWCETSMDSVVVKSKNIHTRPVPPLPPLSADERSKENIYQNQSEIVACLSQTPFDHRPPPLPPTSSSTVAAAKATNIQRTNSSLSCGPMSGTLNKASEIRIESPKNVTVVQQAKFLPYKEVTKPFEMSDFYKYSTKFRQKVMLAEANGLNQQTTTTTDATNNNGDLQGIQKGVYQPPNPSICHPISYQ